MVSCTGIGMQKSRTELDCNARRPKVMRFPCPSGRPRLVGEGSNVYLENNVGNLDSGYDLPKHPSAEFSAHLAAAPPAAETAARGPARVQGAGGPAEGGSAPAAAARVAHRRTSRRLGWRHRGGIVRAPPTAWWLSIVASSSQLPLLGFRDEERTLGVLWSRSVPSDR